MTQINKLKVAVYLLYLVAIWLKLLEHDINHPTIPVYLFTALFGIPFEENVEMPT